MKRRTETVTLRCVHKRTGQRGFPDGRKIQVLVCPKLLIEWRGEGRVDYYGRNAERGRKFSRETGQFKELKGYYGDYKTWIDPSDLARINATVTKRGRATCASYTEES